MKTILVVMAIFLFANCFYSDKKNMGTSVSLEKSNRDTLLPCDDIYEYYEGKIANEFVNLFLRKDITHSAYYYGYMYKSKEVKPMILEGRKELTDIEGTKMEASFESHVSLYKQKYKIISEELILTYLPYGPEVLGDEFGLWGTKFNNEYKGKNYTRRKGVGDEYKWRETFDLKKIPVKTPFETYFYALKGLNKNWRDTVMVVFPKKYKNEMELIAFDKSTTIYKEITKLETQGKDFTSVNTPSHIKTYIIYDKDNLLSFMLDNYSEIQCFNFFKDEKIELSKIISLKDTTTLLNIIRNKALLELKKIDHVRDSIDSIADSLNIRYNYAITPKGLLFSYSAKNHELINEIYNYFQIFISYRELKNILKPEFIKKFD